MSKPIKVLVRDKGSHRALLLYYRCPRTFREVSRSAGTRNVREAERAAARWEKELADSPPVGPANDWEAFRERFELEHAAALGKAARSAYGTALNHFERLMRPARIVDVTASIVSEFQARLLAEKRPLTSVANYLRHVRTVLNFAQHVGAVAKAPRVKLPKIPKRKLMRGRPLTPAEVRKFIRAAAPEWRPLMKLLYLTGMRLSEGLRLSWDSEPLVVQLGADPYPQIIYYAEGHKAGEDDTVPMAPDLSAWLSLTPASDRRGLVVSVPAKGKRAAMDAITAAGKAAGIDVNGRHPKAHDLRRTFGRKWAAKVRPLTLQRMMRHKDIATTLSYYIGLDSADAGAELWGRRRKK